MYRWLNRFCLKHDRKGIANLMRYIIFGNIMVFALSCLPQTAALPYYLMLDRTAVLHGQVWRLVSFIFVSPYSGGSLNGVFFFAIMLYFYYFIGSTLEAHWGRMRFTLFYLSGLVFNIFFCLITGAPGDPTYLNLSLFFAFATLFPDMEVRLFFIIPVKMKYLAYVNAAFFILPMILPPYSLFNLLPMVSILNYILFFAPDLKKILLRLSSRQRRRGKVVKFPKQAVKKEYIHKCAVCGLTDTQAPDMEFRYCSLCGGYPCYCSERIFRHEHK